MAGLIYTPVFALLCAEIGIFFLLNIPLPHNSRRKLYTFLSDSPIVAKIQYGLKIALIYILILFLDAVNRVYRVHLEVAQAGKQGSQAGVAMGAASLGGSTRNDLMRSKAYSERNMYLCGMTLFLSVILNRTYVMIRENLLLEEKLKIAQGDTKITGKDSDRLAEAGGPGEIGKLKNKLAQKDKEIEALRKQSEGLHREYNNLSDQYGKMNADGTPKKDR